MPELELIIDDDEAQALFARAPTEMNRALNEGWARAGSAFFRFFNKRKGIKSRRKTSRKKDGGRGKNRVSRPKAIRLLGFRGDVAGQDALKGKRLSLRTSNPATIVHEKGATIRPKRGRHLFIGIDNLAAARRAGVQIKRGAKPKVIRVRKVVIKPKLNFVSSWSAFIPQIIERTDKALERGAKAADRAAKRKSGGRRRAS